MNWNSFVFVILLTLYSASVFGAQVDTLVVESKVMDKNITNIVIVPESNTHTDIKLPVLYLLHGYSGNAFDWINNVPHIKDYADAYNMIVVCPDGGYSSWYFDSPIDVSSQYETYITLELIEAVDDKYNTDVSSKARGISGLSMGGHGALYLAFKHTSLYGAAGSMSGGVDFRPFSDNWEIAKRLGEYNTHQTLWDENTVVNMIPMVIGKNLKLIIDCGIDDFFYMVNQQLHQKLLDNKVEHDYIERPGDHSWEYWKGSIHYHMLFFYLYFNQA
ncbi:alpha/beta hydrolase [Carboxylicivirga marina]|uniref:Esterase family protein n=1 Tax=Carboxylicivirga marina TaxID=2800988 RepID=A0ABS1HNE1_9BACT|nr:alpha/beta hydrolase family protein [Carboxylicivirga marina]MBK3519151.1 esterase family protein [Carboxylicivirga marina]